MFRLDPIGWRELEVTNLTKWPLNVSSRLVGTKLRVTITGPRHGALVAPDEGLLIATQVAGAKPYGT